MSPTQAELSTKLEELRLKFEQKSAKLAERQAELEASKIEAQELRRCLQANETKRSSLVPAEICAGPGVASNPCSPEIELRRMLIWLAENVIIEEPICFNASCDLITGDQHIQLRNIVQWRLNNNDNLRLSVPEEFAPEISNLLSAAKMQSSVISSAKAKTITDSWLLTQCEDAMSRMTLLTHRESRSSCIVADFPVPPPPTPKQMQVWAGVSVGDHVEVNFKGEWFTGTVCYIKEGGLTYVHCDVDPPDVMTTAPIHMLRRPGHSSPTPPEQSRKKEALEDRRQASL